MVRFQECSICGEVFEVDTCSNDTVCPRCQLDRNIENKLIEHLESLCPELWADNIIEMER